MSDSRAYFVSFSPQIWQPPEASLHAGRDGRVGTVEIRYPRSIRPFGQHSIITAGDIPHRVSFAGPRHVLDDDAHFGDAWSDVDPDQHALLAKNFAGQRLLRSEVLEPGDRLNQPYTTPIFDSEEHANALAAKHGGFVHPVRVGALRPDSGYVRETPHGKVTLLTQSDFSYMPHVRGSELADLIHSHVNGRPQKNPLAGIHAINRKYWPVLIDHASELQAQQKRERASPMSNAVDPHPHEALLGPVIWSAKNDAPQPRHLLAPSHDELMSAGGHATELYKLTRAQPQNATHRMVLADALEDQGHHDAAGFFRSTLPPEAPAKMSRKAGNQETPLRYDRAGMLGMLDKIAKGAGSIYDRVMQGLGRKSSPKSAFFKPPEQAMAQAEHNVGAAEEAEQMLAQQQQDAMNAHVLDNIHRSQSTRRGGTLEQGRSYPMRQGGMHSAETNAALHGECSDAGRRLNECKGDGRYGTHSGRGARL